MNGEVCCILGICCPPEQRAAALSRELKKYVRAERLLAGRTPAETQAIEEVVDALSAHLIDEFDFAPAGTLQPLFSAVATHARKELPPHHDRARDDD